MRIPFGVTTLKIGFVAVDATDGETFETALSSFTVYRSRQGGTATAYTTPTVAEASAANMPGLYWLTIDEDVAKGSFESEEMILRITHASMKPVTRTLELYDPPSAANIRAAVGLASANLDTQLAAIDDAIDTEVGAIKAKTDNLPSDPADQSLIDAQLSAIAGYIDTEVAAIKAKTDGLTFTVAGALDANVTLWKGAAVPTPTNAGVPYVEVTDINATGQLDIRAAIGMAAADLDAQLLAIDNAVDTEVAAIKVVTDKLDTALELDGAVYRFTVNALELAPSGGGGGATPADIADAVWDELLAGHVVSGSAGLALSEIDGDTAAIKAKTDNLPSDPADASVVAGLIATVDGKIDGVVTDVDAIQAKTDQLAFGTANRVNAQVYGMETGSIVTTAFAAGAIGSNAIASNAIGAAELAADAVTEIAAGIAAHVDFIAIKAKTDGLPSDPADASVVAGQIAAVEAKVDTVDGVVDAIKFKTDALPLDPADASDVAAQIAAVGAQVATVDTAVDAIKLKTDNLPSDPADQSLLDAAITAVGTAVADVPTNAEMAAMLAAGDDATLTAIDAVEDKVIDLHLIHGLVPANPMTVTPTSRVAGAITQAITGDGTTTTTVTRTA